MCGAEPINIIGVAADRRFPDTQHQLVWGAFSFLNPEPDQGEEDSLVISKVS